MAWSELKKPVNATSILFGLIGILIGASQLPLFTDVNRISYFSENGTAFDGQKFSDLNVLFRAKKLESRKINIVSFSFWNSGTNSLPMSEMRQKLSIYLSGNGEIIDCKISERSPNASNTRLAIKSKQRCEFEWDFFDPQNFLLVDVLTTDALDNIKVEANYLSSNNILHKTKKRIILKYSFIAIFLVLIGFIYFIISINIMEFFSKNNISLSGVYKNIVIIGLFIILLSIGVLFFYYFSKTISIQLYELLSGSAFHPVLQKL